MKRILCIVMTLASGWSSAKTLYVKPGGPGPSPYNSWETAASNIQHAVDSAIANDTILVAPGIYAEPATKTNVVHITGTTILPHNSTLTLRAAFPPGVTAGVPVIDGQGVNRGILVDGNGDAWLPRTLVIDGFHIVNGTNATNGGGISIPSTGSAFLYLRLLHVTITNNVAGVSGGGLYMASGARPFFPTVSNCVIRYNRAASVDRGGGGLYLESANSLGAAAWVIKNSDISDNTADYVGGGLYVRWIQEGSVRLENVLLAGNSALEGGAYYHLGFSGATKETKTVEFCNTTIVTNRSTAANGAVQFRYAGGSFSGYNLIFHDNKNADPLKRNVTGVILSPHTVEFSRLDPADTNAFPSASNITAPPRFADATNHDYRLTRLSPCINTGTNQPWMSGVVDLAGRPRIDAGCLLVDMGCYEFVFPGGSLIVIR